MRVFVTGASGWIGSATSTSCSRPVTRSSASPARTPPPPLWKPRASGPPRRPRRPRQHPRGRRDAEAVIHLANKHDFANPAVSNRPSGPRSRQSATSSPVRSAVPVGLGRRPGSASGRPATEDDASPFHGPDTPRGGSENLALDYLARGVHTVGVRFAPTMHGDGRQRPHRHSRRYRAGEGRCLLHRRRYEPMARSAPLRCRPPRPPRTGEGTRWLAPARDRARKESPTRQIAEAIGHALDLPVASISAENAAAHFGWIGGFFGMDIPASSYSHPGNPRLDTHRPHPPGRPQHRRLLPRLTHLRARRCRTGGSRVPGREPHEFWLRLRIGARAVQLASIVSASADGPSGGAR